MNEWRRPTGEFENATLGELGEACTRLSFEVRVPKKRSTEERQALADSVADALLRAGDRLTPKPYTPHAPEDAAFKGQTIEQAFGAWHLIEQRAVRYRVIQRAAFNALGPDAKQWLQERIGEPARERAQIAIESDDALVEQLRALDALLEVERKKHRNYPSK